MRQEKTSQPNKVEGMVFREDLVPIVKDLLALQQEIEATKKVCERELEIENAARKRLVDRKMPGYYGGIGPVLEAELTEEERVERDRSVEVTESLRRQLAQLLERFCKLHNFDSLPWQRRPVSGVEGSLSQLYDREYELVLPRKLFLSLSRVERKVGQYTGGDAQEDDRTQYSLRVSRAWDVRPWTSRILSPNKATTVREPFMENEQSLSASRTDSGVGPIGIGDQKSTTHPTRYRSLGIFLSQDERMELARVISTLGDSLKQRLG